MPEAQAGAGRAGERRKGWRCGQQKAGVGRGARLNREPEVGLGCSQLEGRGRGGRGGLGPGVGPRVHSGHVRNQPGAGWGPARGGAGRGK